jgi:ribosomal protein S18 acetylase RimI-like enzyme
MNIRESTAEDFEALYRLDQECFAAGIAYSRRTLRAFLRLPEMMCLVAEVPDGVAGFILTDREEALGHVITLDVAEAFRRRRLGSALLDEAERRLAAAGARDMEIETATTNEAAIAFWKKHGYLASGILEGYYGKGVDAYWMRKKLGGDMGS